VNVQYREGQFIHVPVERDTYAIGVLARAPRRGGVLLGFFFGPRRSTPLPTQWLRGMTAPNAVLACRFKDTRVFRGEWKVLGQVEPFVRAEWPVPLFHRYDGSGTHTPQNDVIEDWRVEYGDDNMIVPVSETVARGADLKLPDDMVYDPVQLVTELAERFKGAAPTVDDSAWR
jgi:hypothetical protein